MLLWDNKFKDQYNSIQKQYPHIDKREWVDEQIRDYIGTLQQIMDHKVELEKEYDSLIKKMIKNKSEKQKVIYDNYISELLRIYKNKYSSIDWPVELFDIAYSEAWDRGHSNGHDEIEYILEDIMSNYIKVYKLGLKGGK